MLQDVFGALPNTKHKKEQWINSLPSKLLAIIFVDVLREKGQQTARIVSRIEFHQQLCYTNRIKIPFRDHLNYE